MNKIQDRLWLGNIQAAQDYHALKQANITHILQVASDMKPFYPKDFIYKIIDVPDLGQTQLIRHFPAATAFIREGRASGGVLVHCHAGISRSSSVVIAFLMQDQQMTFSDAFEYTSSKRPIIFPNLGF